MRVNEDFAMNSLKFTFMNVN